MAVQTFTTRMLNSSDLGGSDLYYKDAELFGSQATVDTLVDNLAYPTTLGIGWDLGWWDYLLVGASPSGTISWWDHLLVRASPTPASLAPADNSLPNLPAQLGSGLCDAQSLVRDLTHRHRRWMRGGRRACSAWEPPSPCERGGRGDASGSLMAWPALSWSKAGCHSLLPLATGNYNLGW